MKKKKVFSAARHGSKRVTGISEEVRVLNLQAAYGSIYNGKKILIKKVDF